MTCSGQITATFTWIPTPANEPPPASAIVEEDSNTDCGTTPEFGGSCDDGLDDPIVGGYNYESSSGTLYTVKSSPGTSFKVTCSPSAIASLGIDEAYGSASVSFKAAAYPVTVNLVGPVKDSSGNLNILVGQGCTASLNTPPFSVQQQSGWTWTVSGTTFQDWGPSSLLLPNASYFIGGYGDPTQPTAHWYWNDSQQAPETVTCRATVTPPNGQGSPLNVIGTQKVTVYVPGWSATGTGTYMQVNTKAPQDPEYELWGNMSWNAIVTTPTTPAFGQGTLELVQIVTPNDSYTTYTHPVQNHSDPANGTTGLDTQYPVSAAIESVPYADDDNPGLPLTSSGSTVAGSAEFQPTFIDYLMYQPPGSDVKWVPIAAFAWSTSGSATIPISGNWSDYVKENFSDSAGTISPSARTSFKAMNTHPSWTRVVITDVY